MALPFLPEYTSPRFYTVDIISLPYTFELQKSKGTARNRVGPRRSGKRAFLIDRLNGIAVLQHAKRVILHILFDRL